MREIMWNQNKILLKQMMETMIKKQGNRTLISALAQNIPKVEQEIDVKDQDEPAGNARAFNVEEDDWNITVERLSVAKMRKAKETPEQKEKEAKSLDKERMDKRGRDRDKDRKKDRDDRDERKYNDRDGRRAADKYKGKDNTYYIDGYNKRTRSGSDTKYLSSKLNTRGMSRERSGER